MQKRNQRNPRPTSKSVLQRRDAGTPQGEGESALVPRGFFRGETNESRYKIFLKKRIRKKDFPRDSSESSSVRCNECALCSSHTKIGGDNIVVGGHRYQNFDRHILQELARQVGVFTCQFAPSLFVRLKCPRVVSLQHPRLP